MLSLLLPVLLIVPVCPVKAVTLYESDGGTYDEGYIFLGESHVFIMAKAMASFTDHDGDVIGMEGVRYHYRADSSVSESSYGTPNTFTMSGNLFFVYEGWGIDEENKTQISKSYIYSDGKGKMGRGVEKIHEIMDKNPNIGHWNIIAWHGASAIRFGDSSLGSYYVKSYENWIRYEFADADCYFLFMPTITKCYRGVKSRNDINDALAAAFTEQYLDYSTFFYDRFPQGMRDPAQKTDTLHWGNRTYIELAADIIQNIQQKRGAVVQQEPQRQEAVTEEVFPKVLYTNDLTVIYEQPMLGDPVAFMPLRDASFPLFEEGLPVQVTGVTDNGFYRICVDGTEYYVPEIGLNQ